SIQLMTDALQSNGIESAKLDMAGSLTKVDSILSQGLSTEQTSLELSRMKLGSHGYMLLMDSSYDDVFNISENYAGVVPLKKLAARDVYNDQAIDATLIKMPISKELYLVGVYSWSDYAGILAKFADTINWLILTIILALVMVSLFVTLDIYLPVKAIGFAVERLANGDFSTQSGLFVEDEAGTVSNNIRKTTENIKSVIKTIKLSSSNIADIADKMMNSIDLTKENILILDKEIKSNAEIIASVQKTLDQLMEYIEGLINSINDTIINSDKMQEYMDSNNKDVFSGLSGSITSIIASNNNLLETIKNIQKTTAESINAGPINDFDYLRTATMQNEQVVKRLGIITESLTDNSNRLNTEIRKGESNKQKIDTIFNSSLATVSSLNDNVERIVTDLNKIDLVIDDTNLLAMNSSVISAQAGKAGRGFDVVSDEITKLASVTQTKILEVKNLTELLVKEKDTIKSNIFEKKRFMDNVDSRLNSFREETVVATNLILRLKESYENILKTTNNLHSKREKLSTDAMAEKEIHHLMKTKLMYVENSVADINKYSADLKDVIDTIVHKWGDYREIMGQIPVELSTINAPANTINGYMSVIKTKTSEIHAILDSISETSRHLNRQLGHLDIRSDIESLSDKINEQPRRYRIL
ncbi:MAG: methyl-accepting chemotaxis protein, partial [Deltaproteobacteria bacterium]|nr:methyl-accepting chemotaxis protein [Deltaproteobacteria bacterium]